MKGEEDYLPLVLGQLAKMGGVIFNKGLKWSFSNGEAMSAYDDFRLASGLLRKLIQGSLLKEEGK